MKIKHGNRIYQISIRMLSSANPFSYYFYIEDKSNFDELMSLEYPKVDISKFNEYYDKLIHDVSMYAALSDKPYKEEWQYIYLYFGIVNDKIIFGRYQQSVADRMMEQSEKEKTLYDGLLCKIDTYGWEVTKHENGLTKVNYFSFPEDGDERRVVFPIYVYKDYLILGNADEDKPSFINNEYFLYNAGKRKKS